MKLGSCPRKYNKIILHRIWIWLYYFHNFSTYAHDTKRPRHHASPRRDSWFLQAYTTVFPYDHEYPRYDRSLLSVHKFYSTSYRVQLQFPREELYRMTLYLYNSPIMNKIIYHAVVCENYKTYLSFIHQYTDNARKKENFLWIWRPEHARGKTFHHATILETWSEKDMQELLDLYRDEVHVYII